MKLSRTFCTLAFFAMLLLPLVGCTPGTPVADFTATPATGPSPLTVQFTDISRIEKSQSITGWEWDFGDGGASTEQNPSHVYTTAGTHSVTLTVTADDGRTGTVTKTGLITVIVPLVTVPDVVGMTQAAAQTAIEDPGLTLGTVAEQFHATIPVSQIIGQDPAGGTEVAQGSAVDLVVSRGPEPVTVPDVAGMEQAAAQAAIADAGLTVDAVTEQYHATIPAGQVISQDPAAGAEVLPGSAVALMVSKGPEPVSVPDVVGMTQATAQAAIEDAGLTLGAVTEEYDATIPAGQVISQDPAAGAEVLPGSAVALVVSKGPEPVSVPDVVGMAQAAAQTVITDAGLTVGAVTEEYHATIPAGQVISQDPLAGSSVAPGSAVSLDVSIGNPVLAMTPVKRLVEAEAGDTSFSVYNTGSGTMNWSASVTSGGSWCRITSGMIGTNAGTVNVDFDANPDQTPRTGEITVVAEGAQGSPVTVTVEQAGVGDAEITILLPGEIPLELVRIPAGSFQMGSPETEQDRFPHEGPLHTVTIGYDFYMGKYEVTQAQWLAVMGVVPGGLSWDDGEGDNYPVYLVTWDDANAFITAANNHITATGQGPAVLRLPSEAEWEYACRAGTQTRLYFGDSPEIGLFYCHDDGLCSQYMWYCGNNLSPYDCKPVGGKLPNEFGLYDMYGNVWEWCEDWWHDGYTGAPADGSAWVVPSGSQRVARGGSRDLEAGYCRSASRGPADPSYYGDNAGFRVASTSNQSFR